MQLRTCVGKIGNQVIRDAMLVAHQQAIQPGKMMSMETTKTDGIVSHLADEIANMVFGGG